MRLSPRRRATLPAAALVAAALVAAALVAAAPVAAPAAAAAGTPATPAGLAASAGATTIVLTWQQPAGPRARSFRVYEGDAVVARNTTTSAVLSYLPFGSTHTYRVTAVDARGAESPPSAPVTARAWVPGVRPDCFAAPALGVTSTAATASAVSVSWPRPATGTPLELRVGGATLGPTTLTSARIGGLTPGTAYQVALLRRNPCTGALDPYASGTVTTAAGAPPAVAAPGAPALTGRTADSLSLAWSAPATGPAPARYAVYEGGALVTTTTATTATVGRLYHATRHRYTVAALDAAGGESAHSAALDAATETCLSNPPRPARPAATVLSPAAVRLTWTVDTAVESYTVYAGDSVVASTEQPAAVLTGLASGSRHSYRVSARLAGACGESGRSPAAAVRTPAGPAARPGAPTGLSYRPGGNPDPYTAVGDLAWSPPAGGAARYRVYDGGALVAETAAPTLAVRLAGGTRHGYAVTAVDAAGMESVPSAPVQVVASFLPPP